MANDKNKIMPTVIDAEYQQWLQQLKIRYRQAQIKAASRVNEELIRYYWQIGADIDARGDENRYGTQFYKMLARDLRNLMPDADGLSETNLKLAVRFYRMYAIKESGNREQAVHESSQNRQQLVANLQNKENQNDTIRQQLVAEFKQNVRCPVDDSIFHIGWGHHQHILAKSKGDRQKALFYVHKTLENQWSRAMLLNMMGDKDGNGGLYEAQGKALTNFAETLPKPDTDLARDILKDPYNLQFLHLYENYQEQDLQLALEQNIVQFLLELGNGFAFVGRQKVFMVDGDEFKADLLFYHLKLRRYVVVELKVVKFQPEFISKLNFYCSCVNHQIKDPEDGDTIGLLICKEKNDVVARWTLEGNQQQPIGISTYRISDLLPTDQQISNRINQLEQELERLRKLQQKAES